MNRIVAVAPMPLNFTRLRSDAAIRWGWQRLVDIYNLSPSLVFCFEDRDAPPNPPTLVEVNAFLALHDGTPFPPPDPPADQVQFTAAVGKLKNTFGTSRSVADVNLCLDALTVVCRRLFQELQ